MAETVSPQRGRKTRHHYWPQAGIGAAEDEPDVVVFGVSHQFFSKVLGVLLLRYTENGARRVQGLLEGLRMTKPTKTKTDLFAVLEDDIKQFRDALFGALRAAPRTDHTGDQTGLERRRNQGQTNVRAGDRQQIARLKQNCTDRGLPLDCGLCRPADPGRKPRRWVRGCRVRRQHADLSAPVSTSN